MLIVRIVLVVFLVRAKVAMTEMESNVKVCHTNILQRNLLSETTRFGLRTRFKSLRNC